MADPSGLRYGYMGSGDGALKFLLATIKEANLSTYSKVYGKNGDPWYRINLERLSLRFN